MTKIRLPADLAKARLDLISPFDLNTFDVDLILPAIFFAVLSEGRPRFRSRNDPTAIDDYIAKLSRHPMMVGFDSDEGRRALGRLARTSLMVTSSIGKSRVGEQIVALVPYTLLAHKAGFPTLSSRLRKVDMYVYEILKQAMGGSASRLKEVFEAYFGKGVTIGALPGLGGSYDGTSEVDVLTRVHLAFMDSFESVGCVPERKRQSQRVDLCPSVSAEISKDLLRYLFTYHDRMPVEELARKFMTLLNFELFIYTQKLVYGLNALANAPREMPPAFRSTYEKGPPEIYVDFTRSPSGVSSQLSAACVHRDLESLFRFMRNSRLVALLHTYASAGGRGPTDSKDGESSGGAEIQRLLLLRESASMTDIAAAARLDERRIRENNEVEGDEDTDPFIDAEPLLAGADDALDRLVRLIFMGQSKTLYQSLTKWYWGTGGLVKANGLLHGKLKGKASWRYEPSDELLMVLVQLAAATPSDPSEPSVRQRSVHLPELLDFWRTRFGLFVERPTADYHGAEFAAAARDNLQAMLGRLRQMGMFKDLSDDFTVQTLEPEGLPA